MLEKHFNAVGMFLQPHIAYLKSEKRFILYVDDKRWKFIDLITAIDVLIKICYVFNLQYNWYVQPFMEFLAWYLFRVPLSPSCNGEVNILAGKLIIAGCTT